VDVTLSLQANELSDEVRVSLVRRLCLALNREAGVPAQLVEAPAEGGAKGVGVSEVITFALAHRAVEMAIDVFAVSILSHPLAKLVLRRKDGREFVLTADSLRPERLVATIGALKQYVAAPRERGESPPTGDAAPEPST
jgi:hypothetical protein